jgi:hypothetical protein
MAKIDYCAERRMLPDLVKQSNMARTTRAEHRFTVKENAPGEPWLVSEVLKVGEPRGSGFVGLELTPGTTMQQAEDLAQTIEPTHCLHVLHAVPRLALLLALLFLASMRETSMESASLNCRTAGRRANLFHQSKNSTGQKASPRVRHHPLSPGFDLPKAPNRLANACCI